MGSEPKYSKSDFKKVGWEEYGEVVEVLAEKVSSFIRSENICIDAVVPIMRAGNFPGTFLAYKLHLLEILPMQYKYLVGNEPKLTKLNDFVSLDSSLPKEPTFLLVENNHCFGSTSEAAAQDLKTAFPNCRIIYAAAYMDYSYQSLRDADVFFYGKLTNETKALSQEEAKEKKVSDHVHLFPWESEEEEWAAIQGEAFAYMGVKK